MHIQWLGHYGEVYSYGRMSVRFVQTLQKLGVSVTAITRDDINKPLWMQKQMGIDWNDLTITCLPAFDLMPIPGRSVLYSMMETSLLEQKYADIINSLGYEKVIVPCENVKEGYMQGGVTVPISVVAAGTDPDEFPVLKKHWEGKSHPYTFLVFGDRGFRKGFNEVWEAFYQAFGGKTTGNQDVRLIVKTIPRGTEAILTDNMSEANGADKRIVYQTEIAKDMPSVYAQADCVLLPSRYEGWGMPHREAACMGIPVVTQKYSGMDDGFTEQWALVVPGSVQEASGPSYGNHSMVDIPALAQVMKWAYYSPETAFAFGQKAARWIRENQTWEHAVEGILAEVLWQKRARLNTTYPMVNSFSKTLELSEQPLR